MADQGHGSRPRPEVDQPSTLSPSALKDRPSGSDPCGAPISTQAGGPHTTSRARIDRFVQALPTLRVQKLLRRGCPHRLEAQDLKDANRRLVTAIRRIIAAQSKVSFFSYRFPGETLEEFRRHWAKDDPWGFRLVGTGLEAIRNAEVRS